MGLLLTGATGYLGSYLTSEFLTTTDVRLYLLIRGRDKNQIEQKLWKAMQLHMDFHRFHELLQTRLKIIQGDLSLDGLGLEPGIHSELMTEIDSIMHCAAVLNRKSYKKCFKVNLKGTLEMIILAKKINQHRPLKRFSFISSVSVAGIRNNEHLREEEMIDWDREDYDPYAITKKFCEQMVRSLLPEIPFTIFRPSSIIGDTRFPQTTQFSMVYPMALFAGLPVLPVKKSWKLDIVPADFACRVIAAIHTKQKTQYDTYHVSAGRQAPTFREITGLIKGNGLLAKTLFIPGLVHPLRGIINLLSKTPRRWGGISYLAALIKVFLPYIIYNTTFDNTRCLVETGIQPASFRAYGKEVIRYALQNKGRYPYQPWPSDQKPGAFI